MGFSEEARQLIYDEPWYDEDRGSGDWLHINSMSLLGENHWWDEGNERFHPENIIWDSRQANLIAITSRETGEIVWNSEAE